MRDFNHKFQRKLKEEFNLNNFERKKERKHYRINDEMKIIKKKFK